MSFSIPLNRPTCVLRAPDNGKPGDWYPAEVENDNTSKVEVHITGTCVNTIAVYYTLSSTHTTADKKYFTNTIENNSGVTAAGGVGVMILDAEIVHCPCRQTVPNELLLQETIIGDPR